MSLAAGDVTKTPKRFFQNFCPSSQGEERTGKMDTVPSMGTNTSTTPSGTFESMMFQLEKGGI